MNATTEETKYSPFIRRHENALASMEKALAFIDQIPAKADPLLLTDEVKADLATRTARLKAFQAQTEADLASLRQWHQVEIDNGRILPSPAFPDPDLRFVEGAIVVPDPALSHLSIAHRNPAENE